MNRSYNVILKPIVRYPSIVSLVPNYIYVMLLPTCFTGFAHEEENRLVCGFTLLRDNHDLLRKLRYVLCLGCSTWIPIFDISKITRAIGVEVHYFSIHRINILFSISLQLFVRRKKFNWSLKLTRNVSTPPRKTQWLSQYCFLLRQNWLSLCTQNLHNAYCDNHRRRNIDPRHVAILHKVIPRHVHTSITLDLTSATLLAILYGTVPVYIFPEFI